MKGQYLTIEWVFFFAIGVAMIISVFFLFTSISSTYAAGSTELQLERTGELLRGSIVRVFEASEQTGSRIEYTVNIPTSLSGCTYAIEMDENLNIFCINRPGLVKDVHLYNINTRIPNNLYSTKGRVIITAENGEVVLS